MLIGYARTSTVGQVAGLKAQQTALAATGCNKLFSEQASSVAQRDQLTAALDFVREGDTLIVTRLARLARSTADLLGIVARLECKQVALRILDSGGNEVDTRPPTGRMLLTMFAAVAEFERAIMLERQRAGVARARAEGEYRGRASARGLAAIALGAAALPSEMSWRSPRFTRRRLIPRQTAAGAIPI